MAVTKLVGADKRQSLDLLKINPLIEHDGNTYHVESVLNLLSSLVLAAADDSLTLSYDQAHGLAFMLETCESALKIIRSGEVAND